MTSENHPELTSEDPQSQRLADQISAIRRDQEEWFETFASGQTTLDSIQRSILELQDMVQCLAGLKSTDDLELASAVESRAQLNHKGDQVLSEWEKQKQRILQEQFGMASENDTDSDFAADPESLSTEIACDSVKVDDQYEEFYEDVDHPEIEELKQRLEEKIRETEIALSLERAEIGRQRTALDEEMHRYEKMRAELEQQPQEKRGFFKRLGRILFSKTKEQIAREDAQKFSDKLAIHVTHKKITDRRQAAQQAEEDAIEEAIRLETEAEARALAEKSKPPKRRRRVRKKTR